MTIPDPHIELQQALRTYQRQRSQVFLHHTGRFFFNLLRMHGFQLALLAVVSLWAPSAALTVLLVYTLIAFPHAVLVFKNQVRPPIREDLKVHLQALKLVHLLAATFRGATLDAGGQTIRLDGCLFLGGAVHQTSPGLDVTVHWLNPQQDVVQVLFQWPTSLVTPVVSVSMLPRDSRTWGWKQLGPPKLV